MTAHPLANPDVIITEIVNTLSTELCINFNEKEHLITSVYSGYNITTTSIYSGQIYNNHMNATAKPSGQNISY